jgi:glucose/mannose transport system permease protein
MSSQAPSIVGSSRISRRVQFILLCLFIPLFTIPFYVVLSASFKSSAGADVSTMWKLPEQWTTSGMSMAWNSLKGNFSNSLLMTIPAVIISSLIGSLNGFILSKYKFKFSNIMFTLMLVGMFIPYQTILIPMVRFLQYIHLYGTLPGLALVHIVYGIPITSLMFRNFYVSIPKAIVEAASIDGAGLLKTFVRIIIPLSIPGFVVAGLFQFTNIWNDFLFGIVAIPNPTMQPVTAALNNLAGTQTVDWNVLMAGSLIAALPTALIYLLLGRYYIQGLTAGSVK